MSRKKNRPQTPKEVRLIAFDRHPCFFHLSLPSKRTFMNIYEEHLAQRKARLLERAQEASEKSAALFQQEREMAQHVPLGQPILVGHHSEGRHRRYLSKMDDLTRKQIALDRLAEDLKQKAEVVGTGGISSDDPEAIQKLEAQLAAREVEQATMKEFNKRVRKLATEEERRCLAKSMLSEDQQLMLTRCRFGNEGFPKYELTNNGASIRRIRARIEELKKSEFADNIEVEGRGYFYVEDPDDNRAIFSFTGKPYDKIRELLRQHGWKWSPTRGDWVRLLTANARRDGRYLCTKFDEID